MRSEFPMEFHVTESEKANPHKLYPIEFTTTATARPDILAQTYASFKKLMRGVDWKTSVLYINIDPVPDPALVEKTLAVARDFCRTVVPRLPPAGNYAAAYKWLWSRPKGTYFFNLEDDWELTEGFDLRLLINHPHPTDWVGVALRAYTVRLDGRPYPYKTCPTSPSLLRGTFFTDFSARMKITTNPEKQLHGWLRLLFETGRARRPVSRMRCYPFGGPMRTVVRDLGRPWAAEHGITLPEKKMDFIAWKQSQ